MARQISFFFLALAVFAGVRAQAQAPAFPLDSITVEGNRILAEKGIAERPG